LARIYVGAPCDASARGLAALDGLAARVVVHALAYRAAATILRENLTNI